MLRVSWLLASPFFLGALPTTVILLAFQQQHSTGPKSGGSFLIACLYIIYLFILEQTWNNCQFNSHLNFLIQNGSFLFTDKYITAQIQFCENTLFLSILRNFNELFLYSYNIWCFFVCLFVFSSHFIPLKESSIPFPKAGQIFPMKGFLALRT